MMTWEEAQQNPDLMEILDIVANLETYLDLMKRYQHDKPEIHAAIMAHIAQMEARARRIMNPENEVLDDLPL